MLAIIVGSQSDNKFKNWLEHAWKLQAFVVNLEDINKKLYAKCVKGSLL